MKLLLKLVSLIVVAGVIYLSVLNNAVMVEVKPFEPLGFAVYTLAVLLAGIFVGAIWMGQFYFAQKGKLNSYKRELEKSSVSNSSNKSKVAVLEAKIATLEKALDDALNK